jgi:hypothetical protein
MGELLRQFGPRRSDIKRHITNLLRKKKIVELRSEDKQRRYNETPPTYDERDAAIRQSNNTSTLVTSIAQGMKTAPEPSTFEKDAAQDGLPVTGTIGATVPKDSTMDDDDLPTVLPTVPLQSASPEEWAAYKLALEKHRQFLSDDDDEVNEEVMKLSGALSFDHLASGARFAVKDIAPLPEPPANLKKLVQADTEDEPRGPNLEEGEADLFVGVDCNDLRFRIALYIIAPEMAAREQEKDYNVRSSISLLCDM